MATSRVLDLSEMTTTEASAIWPSVQGAMLPVGSLEQHGPNLAMSVDTAIAHRLALDLARRLYPRLVLMPALPFGVSHHHLPFVGTITLQPETLDAIISDLTESLGTHGIRKLVIVNAHGGNQAPLRSTAARLMARGFRIAVVSWFLLAADEAERVARSALYGHACEVETSLALALTPSLVRLEALAAGEMKSIPYHYADIRGPARVDLPYRFDELTANGALGDARLATEADGVRIAGTTLTRATAFLEDFLQPSGTETRV